MHLKAITLKGFKSFPDRTRLEFGPGVSVIVGPNGSGKSNITDAVLWALGEQSPLVVRGQSMQDVIFGGAPGQQARRAAEVELIIDTDPDGSGADSALPFPEVSIRRRLERNGEGEYRLNGARCRLVDVLEVLSDTGLGKEMHSVVSQGRVESVVTSKPRDRRLLVEEAAGLGKHRKRRRRAQLKLARTRDNLDRALDVEREARSHLRPLKRQAEAAELHERLERQATEARWELARDALGARRAELDRAERATAQARGLRDEVERALAEVAARREAAEEALAQRGSRHEALSGRRFAIRSAHERVTLRFDQAQRQAHALAGVTAAARARLAELERAAPAAPADLAPTPRAAGLEAQLDELDRARGAAADDHLSELEARRDRADRACAQAESRATELRGALAEAESRCRDVRERRRMAESATDAAARERARLTAQLAATDEFLRTRAARSAVAGRAQTLADRLEAEPGYESALAAALAGRLGAAVAPDRDAAGALLDEAGDDGGRVLVAGGTGGAAQIAETPPAPGAERLSERVHGPAEAVDLARALLTGTWVVDSLDAVDDGFKGIAVTRSGRAWFGSARELHQAPAGGEEHVLAQRNRRTTLEEERRQAESGEAEAQSQVRDAAEAVTRADADRDRAEEALAHAVREREHAAEERRQAAWRIDERRSAPDRGPDARRRAEIEAALEAERRLAAQAQEEHRRHEARTATARVRLAGAAGLEPRAARAAAALADVAEAIDQAARAIEERLEADRASGEGLAAQLRECAHDEAELQSRLRERGESVTEAEVAAQQARDRCAEVEREAGELAEHLGLEASPREDALEATAREALVQRIVRLARRREQLGPVNPLAQDEYADALARVEELEERRRDLETALRELEGLIADTDRRIRESFEETFAATARNFEDLVTQLFPGGRGRLALVREPGGPSPVLGEAADGGEPGQAGDPGEGSEDDDALLGVEIEMTPAGKAMKRLSLLSGGEKSLTALAFLFAVFLARPCPFYVLDEVEAALDDLNIDRFLRLLRRYSQRAQFIVVTHQKRTMEAADTLYGVSMGDDGVSKVISRRLPGEDRLEAPADAA